VNWRVVAPPIISLAMCWTLHTTASDRPLAPRTSSRRCLPFMNKPVPRLAASCRCPAFAFTRRRADQPSVRIANPPLSCHLWHFQVVLVHRSLLHHTSWPSLSSRFLLSLHRPSGTRLFLALPINLLSFAVPTPSIVSSIIVNSQKPSLFSSCHPLIPSFFYFRWSPPH
jgi:hypothetical protein